MKATGKYIFLITLSVLSWIAFVAISIYQRPGFSGGIILLPYPINVLSIGLFVATTSLMVQQFVRSIEKWDVIDLLWKLLVIGVSGISLTFLMQIITIYIGKEIPVLAVKVKMVYFGVALYAFMIFISSAIFFFRKLIFYQKNKRKVFLWRAFEISLLLAFLVLFEPEWLPYGYAVRSALLPTFLIISFFLSANVNWSAYLNFNQKLRSLFLIAVIIVLFIAYSYAFPFEILPPYLVKGVIQDVPNPFKMLTSKYILLGLLYMFPLMYVLFSVLVLIFNLPTSSVFEQRSSELASFQRIHQTVQRAKLDYAQILNTLLDASMLTSNSTAGWITIRDDKILEHMEETLKHDTLSEEEIIALQKPVDLTDKVTEENKFYLVKNLRKHRLYKGLRLKYKTMLVIPVVTEAKKIGAIFLVQELSNTFEEETILSLVALAEQSAIAIENAELVTQSIRLERYMEQVKIAKQVQEQILPTTLPDNDQIEFHAVSQDAEEIGGDYYDVAQINDHLYRVALGDVSGKGTTAAFYMAETKGIFQSLTQLDLSVREFILHTNKALSRCFQPGFFMTLTYLQINLQKKELELLRAGHCQTLFYDSASDKLEIWEDGCPGLAMIRNDAYDGFVPEARKRFFNSGDFVVLFTDGIIEAKNEENEQFGIERLADLVTSYRSLGGKDLAEQLLVKVKNFTGGILDDDYTILVIKFL